MPAPASEERNYLFRSKKPIVQKDGSTSEKHHWWICKQCHAAHDNSGGKIAAPSLVRDRADAYRSHLKRCPFHRGEALVVSAIEEPRSTISSAQSIPSFGSSSSSTAKQQKRMSDFFLSVEVQRSFERDLLEFQSECALPVYFIEKPSTKRLFARMPQYGLPSRKEIGGRMLKANAETAEQASNANLRECQEETGGRVNFLCDVWQNVARLYLLACHLFLFGVLVQFELLSCDSNHHGIAIAKQMEEAIARALALGWIVRAAITDDAGQCARARRILALRWPNIVFLRETLAFIMLCDTRWNSMQACFASLLRVRSALGDLVHAYRNDPEFPKASFRLQKDDNTMTDVVRCYGKIHAAFVASPYASHLVPVVEKRWANCDQPLMLLAFALHPLYVTHTRRLIESHNNTVFLMSVDGISAAADYYYRRYVDANNNGLTGDVDKWLWGKCTPKMYTDFTDPNGILQSSGVIAFWVHVGASKCGKESKLPHIAKVILSVSMNTATCERYFSELGLIHTPRRNKL
ncbi:hypothetical protein F441_08687, partial [Phytophthora nicotianae CJ01A1]